MTNQNIFDKIKQSGTLPQIPQVMLKLIRACNREKTSIEELTGIIATDPSLSSRLIQIIGSPYINLPKAVNSIKTAVVYLGIDTIRNIAISSSAMRFFKFPKNISNFDIARFWYHSYKCAVIAKKVAEAARLPDSEEFFLAGLLHDIGRLVLMQNFENEYKTILQTKFQDEKQISAAEMEIFDTDTAQVSAWLFTQWNLNPLISDAVLFINESIEQIETALSHTKIIFIANFLAEPGAEDKIPDIAGLTDIGPEKLRSIENEADKEVMDMAASLGINMDTASEDHNNNIEHSLMSQVKDLSVFYGTLQNLLHARDMDSVLETTHNGFKIIFNIPRIFYFLVDEKKNILTGRCSKYDKSHKIIKSIAIPLSNRSSLIVKCHKTGKIQNSFKIVQPDKTAVSDTQIIRLLDAGGLYCVPIHAPACDSPSGVIVLGIDRDKAAMLDADEGIVGLFSKQTGICLENIRFHQNFARDVHEKKMDAYAILTDKVIHEINNPIAIIKNYIETLSLKLPDKHPAQQELGVIGEEITRVSGLLDRLKLFSKPGIGGFEPVDINKLCQELLEILKKSILLPKQIESSLDLDPEIPMVKTDRDGLKQVFINIIKNAAEAMDSGGKISVSTRFLPESPKIMIDEKKRIPGTIEITIADNGPGIDKDIMQTLFEPYTTTKNRTNNSGLGLSIVHSIIKELNGTIVCNSQPGSGACFIITLPVSSSRRR